MPFVKKYKMLVWSNPQAPVEVFIRRALLRPDFSILMDAAQEFGISKLMHEWQILRDESSLEACRAAPVTQRMLAHMGGSFK